MARVNRRAAAPVTALLAGALALSGCSGGGTAADSATKTGRLSPDRIMSAPKDLLSAAEPQPNGTMWVLAGSRRSRGLFQLDPGNAQVLGSISVSNIAQSVAQTSTGLIGLALGSRRAGALELLDSHTAKVTRTVPLPAPAREVVVGSDGRTLYVLTARDSVASVSVVDSGSGRVQGAVPVPGDAVSMVPDLHQSILYVLESNGQVSQISIAGGKIQAAFRVGDSGGSLALSPDGSTLYVLKDTGTSPNVAVVDVATESVRRALPAPADCLQVLVSPSGNQLYDVVGTRAYGNVQVFPV
jgi:DNA-binding beta-propeller fold protein YncE